MAADLLAAHRARPAWQQESRLGRRIGDALEYVTQRGAADDYRDYLTTLTDKSEDERYARYTLIRFVIGVTPILGFLGTVVHFGTALSGISFDQLADRLTEIVAEIGQAFNTTTTALAASMRVWSLMETGRGMGQIMSHHLITQIGMAQRSRVPRRNTRV